jgi:large subunit ribosomal protein L24
MKKEYSNKWKGSKQPRKQRKYRANAPLHTRHKMASTNLSKELRTKYSKRNFPIKKGDTIKIMRGEFRGKTGKVSEINMKKLKVLVEGINRIKKDGTNVAVPIDVSNLQITELNLEDNKRYKI